MIHAGRYLLGPVDHKRRLQIEILFGAIQKCVQLTQRTKLHDYTVEFLAVERGALKLHQIGMIQFFQVFDARLFFWFDLFDGDFFVLQDALEHTALCTTAQPLQIFELIKRYVEFVVDLFLIWMARTRFAAHYVYERIYTAE